MADSCVQLFCCVANVLFLAFVTCNEVYDVGRGTREVVLNSVCSRCSLCIFECGGG